MTVLDRSPTGLGRMTVLLADDVDAPGPGLPAWVRGWAGRAGATTEAASGAAPDAAVSRAYRAHRGAVLLLRHDPAGPPRRIVAAVQEHGADRPVVTAAVSAAAACGARLRILHAVPRSFGERSIGLAEAVERGKHLVASGGQAEELGVTVGRDLVRAWPHEVLDETLDADLLVVGGPRPNGPAELGLTARAAVVHAPCSVLVVPRAG